MKNAYQLIEPEVHSTSVVFASPHSGRDYSAELLARITLNPLAIRSSEDAFVDDLFSAAPAYGAPLLLANTPRAVVDLNRSADELDPALIEGVRKIGHNPRISSGLGVIPRVVANGFPIYAGKMTRQEADQRIAEIWQPYHAKLQELLNQSRAMFGEAILIDCHSMPHEAIESALRSGNNGPDVVLGDRFGAAASEAVVERIEAAFAAQGLKVARNTPFAGAYTAQHYGRPSREQHVVQVEIDRSLYMDEKRIEPNADYDAFKKMITSIVAEVSDIGRSELPLAAE